MAASKQSSLSKAQEFYASVYEKARELGATEVQAQLAAAQAVHESTGKSGVVGGSGLAVNHNNLFGMKPGSSWTGKTVTLPTWEEQNGKRVNVPQAFRSYETVEDSIKDYLSRLEARWPEAFNAKTIDEAIAGLNFGKKGGYATDSKYGNKIAKTDFQYSRVRQVAERRIPNPVAFNPVPTKQPPAPIDGLMAQPWGQTPTPMSRPDPASVPEYNREAQRAAAFSALPAIQTAPGGIIDTGRAIVNGMDYTQAAAALQPGFDQYEAGRNLSRSIPDIMSAPGGLIDFDNARFDSTPAFDAGRFATYNAPAPNSPEKAAENAVRNSYFDSLLSSKPAPASTGISEGFAPTSPFGATSRAPSGNFTPTSPFGNGLSPANGLPPAAPIIASGSPQAQSLASAYGTYGNTRSMAPASPKAPTATAIDVPNSAMSLADQYASYGMGKMPTQTAASATQAAPPMEAPRTVAPRQVTPYTPPAQPAMTPEKAKAMGMVPTPGVPGAYMPNVAPNPAQVMKDQLGLIGANPLEAIGRMVVGALQGGVFHSGNGIFSNPGGLWGDPASSGAYGGGAGLGGLGGGINGGAGAFGMGGGNFGNFGTGGSFNSGLQSGSGFTYDR